MGEKVVRYRAVGEFHMGVSVNGGHVRYSDYEALAARVEELEYSLGHCRKGSVIRTKMDKSRQAKNAALKAENERLRDEIDRLTETFKHYHQAGQDEIDTCGKCGLDLRNPVHIREQP